MAVPASEHQGQEAAGSLAGNLTCTKYEMKVSAAPKRKQTCLGRYGLSMSADLPEPLSLTRAALNLIGSRARSHMIDGSRAEGRKVGRHCGDHLCTSSNSANSAIDS